MATHCSICNGFLVSTIENPTIALSSGTYHDKCYVKKSEIESASNAEKRAKEQAIADEKEAARAAKTLETRARKSAQMKAWHERRKAGEPE